MIKKKLVGIVNYNVGNHTSIINLLKKINVEYIFIDGKKNFNKCDILLLPGVGSFAYAIKKIRQKKIDLLINKFVNRKKKSYRYLFRHATPLQKFSREWL